MSRAVAFWKPLPRALEQDLAAREEERRRRAVDRAVDERDGWRCRCCDRTGNPQALTTLGKLHHAHLKAASLRGAYDTKNILLLCWLCHPLHHTSRLFFIVGRNANKPVRFRIAASVIDRVFLRGRVPAHVTVMKHI